VDTGAPQFALVNLGSGIVADYSNIMSSQPPALAGNQRSGNLAPGQDLSAEHFHFGPQGGELSEPHHGVRGVLSDAKDVESRCAHGVVVQGIESEEKSKRVEEYAARPIMFGPEKGWLTESRAAFLGALGAAADDYRLPVAGTPDKCIFLLCQVAFFAVMLRKHCVARACMVIN
jgi:hypothetical protein